MRQRNAFRFVSLRPPTVPGEPFVTLELDANVVEGAEADFLSKRGQFDTPEETRRAVARCLLPDTAATVRKAWYPVLNQARARAFKVSKEEIAADIANAKAAGASGDYFEPSAVRDLHRDVSKGFLATLLAASPARGALALEADWLRLIHLWRAGGASRDTTALRFARVRVPDILFVDPSERPEPRVEPAEKVPKDAPQKVMRNEINLLRRLKTLLVAHMDDRRAHLRKASESLENEPSMTSRTSSASEGEGRPVATALSRTAAMPLPWRMELGDIKLDDADAKALDDLVGAGTSRPVATVLTDIEGAIARRISDLHRLLGETEDVGGPRVNRTG